ncbi:hypothetical protein [Telmatospirillum sp.]|uniref:sodium:calcium antiporter n=1 Tax=Telmatospirillum sp. TaxID=2079197 RepID=UPI00284C2DA7|nr:hypothetical protein [Telmatospirillum sp.]MDR3437916.1 hypothetical protein [Telmatospirillum sp.]
MFLTIGLLLASAGLIYLSCEIFVNGVEWLGRKLDISQTATGTILAAFGTALPESVVTLVATAFSDDDAQRQIGIGAALGGPLALSTVAYGVVGVCLLVYGRRLGRGPHAFIEVNGNRLSRDQAWFLGIFVFKVALGLLAFSVKPWLGFAFLAAYAGYFWTEMRSKTEAEEGELAPLRLRPRDKCPCLGWILLQTVLATAVIFIASRIFVSQLEAVGPWLGLSPQVTALLFSPIATELPETMNAVIWVRQGKERLALANISGAMMIQATIPTAFGLFFTPWLLDRTLLVAAGVTSLSIVFLFLAFRRGKVSGAMLSQVGWLYGIFAIVALIVH